MISPLPGVTSGKPGAAMRALPGITVDVVDDTEGRPRRRGRSSSSPSRGHRCSAPSGATTSATSRRTGRGSRACTSPVTGRRRTRTATSAARPGGRRHARVRPQHVHHRGESALVSHPRVAEAAVVGANDPVTGQGIVAFAILAGTAGRTVTTWPPSCATTSRRSSGRSAATAILVVAELPKTRRQDHAAAAARRGRAPIAR